MSTTIHPCILSLYPQPELASWGDFFQTHDVMPTGISHMLTVNQPTTVYILIMVPKKNNLGHSLALKLEYKNYTYVSGGA